MENPIYSVKHFHEYLPGPLEFTRFYELFCSCSSSMWRQSESPHTRVIAGCDWGPSGCDSSHSPSCGSWGPTEWQRPSRTGRTCTSYGRRGPPGCERWACPSSWRWSRTGRTWTSSHLQQGQKNKSVSHFQASIVGPLYTRSSHTARGEPISPGRLCRQTKYKEERFSHFSCLGHFIFYCVSGAVNPGEVLKPLCPVSSECQNGSVQK